VYLITAGGNLLRYFAPLPILIAFSILSCEMGDIPAVPGSNVNAIELDAGSGVLVILPLSAGVILDSLIVDDSTSSAILGFQNPGEGGRILAFLENDCGNSPEDRKYQLENSGFTDIELTLISGSRDDSEWQLLRYSAGDSTIFERVWPRGSRELLVLSIRMSGSPGGRTLGKLEQLFSGAEAVQWRGSRNVYLSDRSREEIENDLEAVDVTPPPYVTHRLHIEVIPSSHYFSVTDTVFIDFNPTQNDSQLTFVLPPDIDTGTGIFDAIEGRTIDATDSVRCIADPDTRLFSGIYQKMYNEFYLTDDSERILGQVRLSSSFCAEAWFYPGSHLPSVYGMHVKVGRDFDVYVPFEESYRVETDSNVVISYRSPDGGIHGPVSWVVGSAFSDTLLAGRTNFIYPGDEDGISEQISAAMHWTETTAAILWNNIGFEGARLDYVIVSSLDAAVFLEGAGCIFASPDVLAGLAGHGSWASDLAAGIPVAETAVVAHSASAMMRLSTHLPDELRDMIAAWTVYLFCSSVAEEPISEGALILEAFRKYYLYSTELTGGIEYSLADPELLSSPLGDPVLYGKGPCVLVYFTDQLPRFSSGLKRALGSLRHPGNPWTRILSGLRLPSESSLTEFFWDWLFYPGIPQIHVNWMQTGGILVLTAEQKQPGSEFPVHLIELEMTFLDGTHATAELEAFGTAYTAVIPHPPDTVTSIDLNPSGKIPADITYERNRDDEN
jgi:hypothetical protein